jgi:hypothetical protein
MAHEYDLVIDWFTNLRSGRVEYPQRENARQIMELFCDYTRFKIYRRAENVLLSVKYGGESDVFDEFMRELIRSPPERFVDFIRYTSVYEQRNKLDSIQWDIAHTPKNYAKYQLTDDEVTTLKNKYQQDLKSVAGLEHKDGEAFSLDVETFELDGVQHQKLVLTHLLNYNEDEDDYDGIDRDDLPPDDDDEDEDEEN